MRKITFCTLTLATAVILFLGGRSLSQNSKTSKDLTVLTIGTADAGGTMSPVGTAIADTITHTDNTLKVNVSTSNGSTANVRSLHSGEIDLGLVSGDIASAASKGTGEFKDAPVKDLQVIAAIYPSLSNWIAPRSLNIQYVHNLKGKRIGVGPQDSSTEISALTVFDVIGIDADNSTLVNCGLGSGTGDIQNETLDAMHGFAGIPISSMDTLSQEIPTTILQYTDKELDTIIKSDSLYYKDIIPAGTYEGQTKDIKTFGIKCLLCVRADMSEDLVYEITKTLYQHKEELIKQHPAMSVLEREGFMYQDLPLSLHSGAKRFYIEEGLLTN